MFKCSASVLGTPLETEGSWLALEDDIFACTEVLNMMSTARRRQCTFRL